jgi:hypothetical protein
VDPKTRTVVKLTAQESDQDARWEFGDTPGLEVHRLLPIKNWSLGAAAKHLFGRS